MYFKASWITRGLVVVICPNLPGVFLDVAGLPKCGWLNRLETQASHKNAPPVSRKCDNFDSMIRPLALTFDRRLGVPPIQPAEVRDAHLWTA